MSDMDVKLRLGLIRDTAGPARKIVGDFKKIEKALNALEGGKPIRIRTDGSTKKTVSSIKAIGTAVNASKEDLLGLKGAVGTVDNQTLDKLRSEVLDIGSAADKSKGRLQNLKEKIELVDRTKLDLIKGEVVDIGTKSDGTVADLQELKAKLNEVDGVNLKGLKNEFDGVGSAAEKAGKKGKNAGGRQSDRNARADAFREGFDRLDGNRVIPIGLGTGAAVGALGAGGIIGLVVGLRKVVSEAMTVEDAMADVRKSINVPEAEMDETIARLKNRISQLSRTSALAQEDIATLFAVAGRLGIGVEDLDTTAMRSAKASIAFEMTPEDTATRLAKIKSQTGATEAEMDDFVNVINHLGDNTSAREHELLNFAARTASTTKLVGLSSEHMAALGAVFIELSTPAEVASNAVKSMITTLSTAPSASERQTDAMKKLGLSPNQVVKDLDRDPMALIKSVLDRLSKFSGAEQIGILADMFGREYADDIAKLVAARKTLDKTMALVKDPADRKGSVDKSFDIFSDPTSKKLAKLGNAFDALAVKLGDKLLPAVEKSAEALTNFINSITDDIESTEEADRLAAKAAIGVPQSEQDRKALETNPKAVAQFWREAILGSQQRMEEKQRAELILQGLLKDQSGTVDVGKFGGSTVIDADKIRKQLETRLKEIGEIDATINAIINPDLSKFTPDELRKRIDSLSKQAELTREGAPNDLENKTIRLTIEAEIKRAKEALENPAGPAPKLPALDPATIEMKEKLRTLKKQLDQLQGSFTLGPVMEIEKQANIEAVKREIDKVKKTLGEDLGPSASNAMDGYNQRLTAEIAKATGIASRAGAEMARALSFHATPTISPRFNSAQPTAKVASVSSAKTAAAPQQISNTFHINGSGNPHQIANAVQRKMNRSSRGSKSAALHDTGAIA